MIWKNNFTVPIFLFRGWSLNRSRINQSPFIDMSHSLIDWSHASLLYYCKRAPAREARSPILIGGSEEGTALLFEPIPGLPQRVCTEICSIGYKIIEWTNHIMKCISAKKEVQTSPFATVKSHSLPRLVYVVNIYWATQI